MDRVLRPVQTLTNFSKCQGYNDADASARRMKIRCISYLEMCENHLWSKDIMYKLELHWNIYALNINVWQTVFDTVGKLPVKTVETNIINFRMFFLNGFLPPRLYVYNSKAETKKLCCRSTTASLASFYSNNQLILSVFIFLP